MRKAHVCEQWRGRCCAPLHGLNRGLACDRRAPHLPPKSVPMTAAHPTTSINLMLLQDISA